MKIRYLLEKLLVCGVVAGVVGCGDEGVVVPEVVVDDIAGGGEVVLVEGGEVKVFEGLIRPLLDDRCVSCHNEKKHKEGVRLDHIEGVMAVLEADDGEGSALVGVINGHEDYEQMPPKEKYRFSGDQVAAIVWWADGLKGDFDKKMGDVEMPAEVKGVYEALQMQANEVEKKGGVKDSTLVKGYTAGALAAVAELRGKQVSVMRVSGEGKGLLVDFTAPAKRLGVEDLKLLEAIGEDVAWLKVARMDLGDDATGIIAGLKGLRRLDLSYTKVTDAGIKELVGLEKLEVLKLVGTGIGDETVVLFNEMKGLRAVYLYGSKVSSDGVKLIRDGIVIDLGVYEVAAVVEDGMASIRPDGKKGDKKKADVKKGVEGNGDKKTFQVANTVCPVSGAGVKEGNFFDYEGKRVGFCCQKCRGKFVKDPKAFFAKLKLKLKLKLK